MYSQAAHGAPVHSSLPLTLPVVARDAVADRTASGTTVIDIDAPLTAESAAQAFCDRVRDLLDRGQRKFVVNLAEVSEIDSYGLGGLAAAHNWITETGGQIRFYGATPRVRRTIERLRLDSVLAMYEDETEALGALNH